MCSDLYEKVAQPKNVSYVDVQPNTKQAWPIAGSRQVLPLEAEDYGTGQTVVQYMQTVLLGAVHSHVTAQRAERPSFGCKWGAAGWGE